MFGSKVSFFLDNAEYQLTPEQAKEVDEQDAKYPADDAGNLAFNTWFRSFLRDHHIYPVNRRMARYWTKTTNTNDTAVKFALTARAMKSVVAVVDPHHKLQVEFKSDAHTSYWDNNNKVVLPSFPVKKIDNLHEAIDVMTGFAIHEADHSKHTRPLLDSASASAKTFLSSKMNMQVANLLEDARCDPLEFQENPGFEPILKGTYDFMWNQDAHHLKQFPELDELNPKQRLSVAAVGVRYPEKVQDHLHVSHQTLAQEAKKIADRYVALGNKAKFNDLRIAVEDMKSLLQITLTDEEEENASSPRNDDGDSEQGKIPLFSPCDYKDNDAGLDSILSERVNDLVQEELQMIDPKDKRLIPDGAMLPETIVMKKPRYVSGVKLEPLGGLLQKAKAAIQLRRAAPRADERHMLSGELDEDELYRLMGNDMRVFRDITEEVVPSAAVYLIVDMSASMRSYFWTSSWKRRIDVAQHMAHLLVSSLKDNPNVTVKVFGQTGDVDSIGADENAVIFRIWEPGDPLDRLSVIKTEEHGSTYDSPAIAIVGDMLANEAAEQKLLIVLSDGTPEGMSGYGGWSARKHVRQLVEGLSRRGVVTMNLSMDRSLDDKIQEEMYGKNFVSANVPPSQLYDHLLRNLQKLLVKISTRSY